MYTIGGWGFRKIEINVSAEEQMFYESFMLITEFYVKFWVDIACRSKMPLGFWEVGHERNGGP